MKVVLLGEKNVGKTTFISHYPEVWGFKREHNYYKTVGVNIKEAGILLNEFHYRFVIWDVNPAPKFQTMRKYFLKNADSVLFLFDLTNRESFNYIKMNLEKFLHLDCSRVLIVGNKADLLEQRQIANPFLREIIDPFKNLFSKKPDGFLSYFELSLIDRQSFEILNTFLLTLLFTSPIVERAIITTGDYGYDFIRRKLASFLETIEEKIGKLPESEAKSQIQNEYIHIKNYVHQFPK